MNHLTPDELIDAVEGILTADRQAHLDACEHCRRQIEDLAGVLHEAREVTVPEPSPLFWDYFSARVREAVGHEPAPGRQWPEWLRWQVLLPVGATALIILGLMTRMPIERGSIGEVTIAEPTPVEPMGGSWSAVEDLVGQLDVETASAAGVIEPGVAELAVLELTAEEQQELTRLLQAELIRAKS